MYFVPNRIPINGCCSCCGSRKNYCCGSVAVGSIVTGVFWVIFAFLWMLIQENTSLWWLWILTGWNGFLGLYGIIAASIRRKPVLNMVAFILHSFGIVVNLAWWLIHLYVYADYVDKKYGTEEDGYYSNDEWFNYLGNIALFGVMLVVYTAMAGIPIDLHVSLWKIRKAGGTGYEHKSASELKMEAQMKSDLAQKEVDDRAQSYQVAGSGGGKDYDKDDDKDDNIFEKI
eukprot:GHVU01007482.1.p1 GENE.GHVU01007482.1~~GHVU01007482.1.p1  ORF type:complete len:229 (+),score=27.47 GHVU01007482.1:2014-2700(+)